MKVILNKDEIYNIDIPREVNAKEFQALLTKLDRIAKLMVINIKTHTSFNEFKKDYQAREIGKIKKIYNTPTEVFYDSKEKCLDLLQYYYHGDDKDRERILNLIGITNNNLSKKVHALRVRYSIKPEEVGLMSFKQGNPYLPLIKIKDYKIKSYTGFYDAPE